MVFEVSIDSKEGVARFFETKTRRQVSWQKKTVALSEVFCAVTTEDGGVLYHVCVDEDYRRHGIGKRMVVFAMKALKEEKINKVSLIAFTENDIGNAFWNTIGWTERLDLNYYDFT